MNKISELRKIDYDNFLIKLRKDIYNSSRRVNRKLKILKIFSL